MSTEFKPRHAVRALLVEQQAQRVLLIHTWVPDTDTLIWLAPGGGLHPNEEPLCGLFREVFEETGFTAHEAYGPVWHRQQKFHLHGHAYDQYEDYYYVPVKHFAADNRHNPALDEKSIFRGFYWWSAAELEAATDEIFVPLQFAKHFRKLIDEGPPDKSYDVGR